METFEAIAEDKLVYPKYPCASDRTRQLLETIHETFARDLSVQLSAYLRTAVEVRQSGSEEFTFREFSGKRAPYSCTGSISTAPWNAPVVVNIQPEIAFPFLELMLGGKPPKQSPAREMTGIEQNLMAIPLRAVAAKLRDAWARIVKLDCRFEGIEDAMTLPRLLPREEPLFAVHFELTVAEQTGRFSLLLPSRASGKSLQAYLASNEPDPAPHADAAEISVLMMEASVRFEVSIERVSMQLRDLLNLREGYVVKFDHPTSRDVDALLNGHPGFRGQVVSTGRRRAFLVSEAAPGSV